jgi:hypothetical protein
VREFDAETVAGLAALSRATRDDDGEAMMDAMEQVGARPPRKERDVAMVRELLRGFYGPMVEPGARPIDAAVPLEARSMLRSKRQLFRMQLPGKLLFLFRIRFGLYAVLARLGAVQDWRALEEAAAAGVE